MDPSPAQWQQLKGVLTAALKVPVSERERLLQRELADDDQLRACAQEMLSAYDNASRPFDVRSTTAVAVLHETEAATGTVANVVGDYSLLRKLGEGGMGAVYLAEDLRLGRLVALKFLLSKPSEQRADANVRLLSESRSAAILNHPAIVTLHDVFEWQGELVAVMEFVEGRPLSELIGGEPLSIGFALRLGIQLADAVGFAHGRGVVHCDLKPANIHVLPNGSAKILDFGLARIVSSHAGDFEKEIVGTPGYLAPERLRGRPPTAAADVYSLGVVLYELLTGAAPFTTGDASQLFVDTLTTAPEPLSARGVAVSPVLDQMVMRCLAKSPRERPQPHELSRTLGQTLLQVETAPIPFEPVPLSDTQRLRANDRAATTATTYARTGDRWPMVVALAVVATVAVLGIITSASYLQPLGLVGRFAIESPLLWPVWGFRAALPVLMLGGLILLALLAVRGCCRLIVRLAPGVGRAVGLFVRPAGSVIEGASNGVVAPLVLVLQVLFFAGMLWRFQPMLGGFDGFMSHASSQLAVLAPDNADEHWLMWMYEEASFVGFGLAWAWIWRRNREPSETDVRSALAGGMGLMLVSLVVFQVLMFRVLYHNEAERVSYQSRRCYLMAEQGDDALLFCPAQSNGWTQVVKRDAIKREGVVESIFCGFQSRQTDAAPQCSVP